LSNPKLKSANDFYEILTGRGKISKRLGEEGGTIKTCGLWGKSELDKMFWPEKFTTTPKGCPDSALKIWGYLPYGNFLGEKVH